MTTATTLTKTETKHLLDAAGQGGTLSLPETLRPTSRDRLLGRLLRDELVVEVQGEGGPQHRLTPAGYRAVGLRPPRARAAASAMAETASPSVGKKEQVLALLRREEGASLADLMAATGWLPHTTRAALSRLRSAGEPVLRSSREGVTVYRIAPPASELARAARQRKASADAQVAA